MSEAKKTDYLKRFRLLDRNGRLISWCSKKKKDWYLQEGIVKPVGDDAIQFLVETAVDFREKHPEALSYKDCCVVCGTKEGLSSHHVVPYSFVEFFTNDWKDYCEHDVVYLCVKCHNKYEKSSHQFRMELLKKYGVSAAYDRIKGQAIAAANTIRKRKVPNNVKEKLLGRIVRYLNKTQITDQDIKAVSKLKLVEKEEDRPSAQLVRNLTDIGEFCALWRDHFIKTMKPKHLTKGWDINYDRQSKGLL
jgi:exonuclease 3'-5' domain-containing protein 2